MPSIFRFIAKDFSHKQCFDNATWNAQTDYSTCSITPRLIVRSDWHTAMLSLSLIVCLPAIGLLFVCSGGHRRKLSLIRNLIVAIFVRNLLVLLTKRLIIMDELTGIYSTAMSVNAWPCKLLAFGEKFATNIVFTCMLLEGIYLHQLLTNVFSNRGGSETDTGMTYFNSVGIGRSADSVWNLFSVTRNLCIYTVSHAGISTIMAVSWATVMAIFEDTNCWIVNDANQYHWINDSMRLVMLLANTGLLLHITITLWRSFRGRETDSSHAAL